MNTIYKIVYCLTAKEKKYTLLLFFIIFFTTILEFFSFSLFIPALNSIFDTDKINFQFLDNIINFLNIFNINKFSFVLVLLLFFYIAKNILLIIFTWFQYTFVNEILVSKANHLLNLYVKQDYLFHANTNVSELMRNIEHEANQFQNAILQYSQLIAEISISLAILSLLALTDAKITLASLIMFISITMVFYKVYKKKLLKVGRSKIFYSDKMIKHLLQAFGAIKEIKISNKELFFLKKYESSIQNYANFSRDGSFINACPRIFIEILLVILIVTLISTMMYLNYSFNEVITILMLFGIAAFRFIPSINRIVYSVQTLTQLKPSVDLIYNEFKKYDTNLKIKLNDVKKIKFKDCINFKNVTFNYFNQKKNIFEEFSLKIDKNNMIGITGETGSGKSTALNLLLGLIDPVKGEINIDGKNLIEIRQEWQSTIGFVPQSIYLLDDTITKNIAFGVIEKDIDYEKIKKIIKELKLDELINNSELGLETLVGERGVRISGGQLQRIGIARALYKDPDVLVLDEITSSLDNTTEDKIMRLIENFKGKKTIILISHKKRCLENCDQIINL